MRILLVVLLAGPQIAAAEVILDSFAAPRSDVEIRRPGSYPDRPLRAGGRGYGVRLERLPATRQGWTLHADYIAADGEGPGESDLEELRLGIGGQLARPRFRTAIYAEYSRLELDAGHIDGAGIQVRFHFRHADPLLVDLQLGHRCLEGELRFPGYGETLGFDLAEVLVNLSYRMNRRLAWLVEARRSWEVFSPNIVDLDRTSLLAGVRVSL